MGLAPGATFSFDYDVRRRDLVCFQFKRAKWDWILRWRRQPPTHVWRCKPKVIATAVLAGLLEWAAMEALRRVITVGHDVLGTTVTIRHSAPVFRGVTLRIVARCTDTDGPRSRWVAYAYEAPKRGLDDASEPRMVAQGTVGFHVVNTEEFLARVARSAWRRSRVRPRFCHRWWVVTKADLRAITRWCRPTAKPQAPADETNIDGDGDIADVAGIPDARQQQERVGVFSGLGASSDRDHHHPGC